MKKTATFTRLVLIALTALLALPIAQMGAPVEAKKRSRAVTRTFGDAASITIPTSTTSPVSANLYPSTIPVGGLKGRIRDVNVRLNDFSHSNPADVQVLLVGPNGQTAVLMAAIGGASATGVKLRLDDEAAVPLPDDRTLQSRAYRPTNFLNRAIAFNSPAPSVGANAALAVFDGSNPNGSWRLFVQDNFGTSDSGAFAGGWSLEITTKVKVKKKR